MYISRFQPAYAISIYDGASQRGDRVATDRPAANAPGSQVEFSGAARELAKQYSEDGLTAERIGALRHQIERGIYPEPSTVEELAWRLIESGVV